MTVASRLRHAGIRIAHALVLGPLGFGCFATSISLLARIWPDGFGVGGFLVLLAVAGPLFLVGGTLVAWAIASVAQAIFLLAGRGEARDA